MYFYASLSHSLPYLSFCSLGLDEPQCSGCSMKKGCNKLTYRALGSELPVSWPAIHSFLAPNFYARFDQAIAYQTGKRDHASKRQWMHINLILKFAVPPNEPTGSQGYSIRPDDATRLNILVSASAAINSAPPRESCILQP